MVSPEREHTLSLGYSLKNGVHALNIFYPQTQHVGPGSKG